MTAQYTPARRGARRARRPASRDHTVSWSRSPIASSRLAARRATPITISNYLNDFRRKTLDDCFQMSTGLERPGGPSSGFPPPLPPFAGSTPPLSAVARGAVGGGGGAAGGP